MDNSPASTVASSISPRSSKTSNRLSLRLSDVLSAVSAHEFRYNPAAMAQTHYDVIIPAHADPLARLVKHVHEYDELELEAPARSGRAVVSCFLSDPLLTDIIFCPLMIYGDAQERDMEFGQFVVMFKSIFCEGL